MSENKVIPLRPVDKNMEELLDLWLGHDEWMAKALGISVNEYKAKSLNEAIAGGVVQGCCPHCEKLISYVVPVPG